MFNLSKFISSAVTFRPTSMFAADIEANRETLVRQAHHELVYPELVEGMPYGNSFRISNMRNVART